MLFKGITIQIYLTYIQIPIYVYFKVEYRESIIINFTFLEIGRSLKIN